MRRQISEGPMSSVIMSEENDDIMPPPALAKKTTATRATATAAQLHHVARMMKKKDYNIIFKHVSIMYVREKGKGKSCMSAKRIADLIRYECAVKLWCPRTIQKKVNEGDIGCSPLRLCLEFPSTTSEISVSHSSHSFESISLTAPCDSVLWRWSDLVSRWYMAQRICISLQANEEKALVIVEQGKLVNSLNVADLGVLLAWHHVPKTKGARRWTNYNSGCWSW